MPAPTIPPMTIMVASKRPRRRARPGFLEGVESLVNGTVVRECRAAWVLYHSSNERPTDWISTGSSFVENYVQGRP